MRLRTAYLGTLVLVALVLSGTAFAGFALYKDAVVEHERQELAATSQSVANDVDQRLSNRMQTVELWGEVPAVTEHGTVGQRAALRTLMRRTEFSGASVVAANGTMTAIEAEGLSESRRTELVGQDFSGRKYVRAALAGETYVSDPVLAESGNYIVTVSTPLMRDGRTVATLNAAFHLTEGDLFSAVWQEYDGPRSLRVQTGNETLFSSERQVRADDVAETTDTSLKGWSVTVSEDPSIAQAHVRDVTLMQSGALGIILLSLVGFGAWLYRTHIRQISTLEEGLSALESGEYDVGIHFTGPDEWVLIGERFNAVSETLERRESQVRILNRVLRHNLRNAMVIVRGNAENVIDRTDDEDVVSDARRIQEAADDLLELADHARTVETFMRPDTKTTPQSIDTLVSTVVGTLREGYPEVTLDVDVHDGHRVPEGRRIAAVLEELGRNAIEHNDLPPAERRVSITATPFDGESCLRLAVSDNGGGLPDIEHELLTGAVEEKPTSHGSGLGLWMTQWLVGEADGDIDVVDEGTRGTTIVVTLPILSDGE